MLHEIGPDKLDNSFKNIEPKDNDYCICFNFGNIMVRDGSQAAFPTYGELKFVVDSYIYLFSIAGRNYFLCLLRVDDIVGYEYMPMKKFRALKPKLVVYAGMTAYHLYIWYRDNRFCGRCGNHLVHDKKERMLFCGKCNNQIFPKIMPAVIVAVTCGDKILVSKYKGREYRGYALIAGFTEIGETAEETVEREVLEETGIKVKNIKYFATQPWGIAQDLLLGYFCEADEGQEIKVDDNELSWASWVSRDELDIEDQDMSLTNRMLYLFSKGEN